VTVLNAVRNPFVCVCCVCCVCVRARVQPSDARHREAAGGQLLPDRLPGNRNGPRQAFRTGRGLRRLQPRQLRPGLRTGQALARTARVLGLGPDADRAHHVPSPVRRPAPA